LLYAFRMILQIKARDVEPDITVLTLTGKITLGRESQRMEGLVKDLIGQNKKKLVFDLSGVSHIDSAGLGIITYCSAAVTEAGGGLRLAGVTGMAEKLLHFTRLAQILPCFPDVQTACRNFLLPQPSLGAANTDHP